MHSRAAALQHGDLRLESFDLNLLRALDALLATRSVSLAAQRIALSQPATSAALSRLRTALHDPLLVRNGNRMVASPLAEELRPRLTRILEDIGDALGAAASFNPARTERRFRIGANDYAALVLLAPLARELQRLAPRATLEVLPCDGGAGAGLFTRETDLVVADRWTLRDFRNTETLFHESFVSIARADHPRLSPQPNVSEFIAEGHALISTHGVTPGVLDSALEALGHSRRVALTVPHYLAAPAIVAHTDLIMTLPRRIADCFAGALGLRVFTPPVALQGFDVVMAFHPRSAGEPAIQWLKQTLRSVAAAISVAGGGDARARRSARRK
jgi:DNA-binding transcriptional LysR family regulator